MELQKYVGGYTKPVINFDVDPLIQELDNALTKYKDLVFTDETASDCKKTIEELNKGKREVEDFRKRHKQEMTAPITAFENQCKKLTEKIDAVVIPLKTQFDAFEVRRKAERDAALRHLMPEVVGASTLNAKFEKMVVIKPEYYNKTATPKSVEKDIREQVTAALIAQATEQQKIDLMNIIIESVNASKNLQVKLTFDDIAHMIEADAETIKNEIERRAEARRSQEVAAVERIRKQEEAAAQAKIEAVETAAVEQMRAVVESVEKTIPVEQDASERVYSLTLAFQMTKSEMEALKAYLDMNNFVYRKVGGGLQ